MNQPLSQRLPALILVMVAAASRAETISLSSLDLSKIQQAFAKPQVDHSVDKNALTIAGKKFDHGIGSHADSSWWIQLDGKATRLTASVGMDDEVQGDPKSKASGVDARVIGDGKVLFDSGPIHVGDEAKAIDVDLHGVQKLILAVEPVGDGIDYAHVDWVDGQITFDGTAPASTAPTPEPAEILTPPALPTPRINGAKIIGVRPGHPLLYTIPVTGDRPMTFTASGLPDGVTLDGSTGRITGVCATAGEYAVKISAKNSAGDANDVIHIKVGPNIALTPPMGWNSWNCFARNVSDANVRSAADAMVSSGLINHGWTYINIDDCWQVSTKNPPDQLRAPDGHVLTNDKFPDMKALADYIHGKGLRAGLYSSPGPATCAHFTGSYQHEVDDAKQYAAWGFDYLKYDWCSYGEIAKSIAGQPNPPSELEIDQHPYAVMKDALLQQNRDILYSFCQYGMGDVWKWGESFGGNCWRTTGDIRDTWSSMAGIGFGQAGHEQYSGPGHWNDPDMLVVGHVGWGRNLHPTHLTPNEQYTHITLWCLLDAPLLIGCDMTQLDPFTLSLLTNDEVLAVDQDSLGQQAHRVSATGGAEVWAKQMSDGSTVIGLFNRSDLPQDVVADFALLKLTGPQRVRDLWRQKDIGVASDHVFATIGRHGATLLKLTAAATSVK
ncbi:MAG: NPCBM/NEW2 domain-containing protein [Phycisphaerae bacterium]|nr:NPCBM/NEW2 domain-containing protein [Phycisphaerae bacterium]